jgi:hypothetical protein
MDRAFGMTQDPRRAAPRKRYLCEAHIDGIRESTDPIRIADLSASGAFVDTRQLISPGLKIRLTFEVLKHPITVTAEVVYCTPPYGMGVRFLDLNEEDRALIEMLPSEDSK